jgi:hypothetical protein
MVPSPAARMSQHGRRTAARIDHRHDRLAADADAHNVCEAVGVTFDLTGPAERIRMRAADREPLSASWAEREISPNYGKAATSARFECEQRIGGDIDLGDRRDRPPDSPHL